MKRWDKSRLSHNVDAGDGCNEATDDNVGPTRRLARTQGATKM